MTTIYNTAYLPRNSNNTSKTSIRNNNYSSSLEVRMLMNKSPDSDLDKILS